MKLEKDTLTLYALTDRSFGSGQDLCSRAEAALKGGVTCLQYREKELKGQDYIELGSRLKKLCSQYRVPFLLNDYVDLVEPLNADGVHVGQNDLDVAAARRKLGPDKIIGASARTVEQALRAWREGADYLGAGAVFGSTTKTDANKLALETLAQICRAVPIPVVAIGGINGENMVQLKGRGIAGVALISAVFAGEEITAKTKRLKQQVQTILEREED